MSISDPTDEELRELFFLFPQNKSAAARNPDIEPIRLADEQIDNFLNGIWNVPDAGAGSRNWVRKELVEAVEYFCSHYYFQEYPSPSATMRKLESIQAATRKLIQSLGVQDKSPESMPSDIQSYLQIAADEYGWHIGKRAANLTTAWNFWSAYKLPSIISGVQLLDHWTVLALSELQRNIAEKKKAKRTGNYLGDSAIRVLIHQLARVYMHAHSKRPGTDTDGPFIRFASAFIEAMKENVTEAQRAHFAHIDHTLSVSPDAIRNHLRGFNARLAASAANQAAKTKKKVKSKRGKN